MSNLCKSLSSLNGVSPPDRPRERLLRYGAEALSDVELLAALIGSGSKSNGVVELAKLVLKLIDQQDFPIAVQKLKGIDGIGLAKACQIVAALEFSRRRIRPAGHRIESSADVLPLVSHLRSKKQEHFLCISLNGAIEVIATRVVTIGLVDRSQIHPREVFADPITDRASAIIVAHNHPASLVDPSEADLLVTKQLQQAGTLLGIELLDHIIFNQGAHFSFRENGLL